MKKKVSINIYPYLSCKDVQNALTEAYGCHRKQTKSFCKTSCGRNRGKNTRDCFDHSSNCLVHAGGTHCLLLRHHWFLPRWLRRVKTFHCRAGTLKSIAPKPSAKIRGLKLDCALPSAHSEGATRENLRRSPQLSSTAGFKGYPSQSATRRKVGKRQNTQGCLANGPKLSVQKVENKYMEKKLSS